MLNRKASFFRKSEAGNKPLPSEYRNTFTVVFGEFCGTFMFLLLAFIGTQAALDQNNRFDPDAPLAPYSLFYIATSFGVALTVNVWIFYRVTGGMFNPAVTMGLALVGAVKPLRAILVVIAQIAAGMAAAAVADAILPGSLGVANKLGNGTSIVRGLFLEMFMTSQLVLTVFFLAVEKHRATFLAPIGIGMAVFIAHICNTNFTGTGINPARSFGPAVVTSFTGYQWIYWLGPFMGSLLAFGVYSIFKWLDYRTANPGQDWDDLEKVDRDATSADGWCEKHHNHKQHGHHSRGMSDGAQTVVAPPSPTDPPSAYDAV